MCIYMYIYAGVNNIYILIRPHLSQGWPEGMSVGSWVEFEPAAVAPEGSSASEPSSANQDAGSAARPWLSASSGSEITLAERF